MNKTKRLQLDSYQYINVFIKAINNELKNKKMDSIETMACSTMPLEDIAMLVLNLEITSEIRKKYGAEVLNNIYNYIHELKKYISELTRESLINFDTDVKKSKDCTKTKSINVINANDNILRISNRADSKGNFAVIYKKSHTDMNEIEITKTLEQFKRAVGVFFETYQGREIIGRLTGYQDGQDREIKMELKAHELLHILGITRDQVLFNNEFRKVLNLKGNESSLDILEAIYKDIAGDNNLILAHNDKKIQSELLPYNKIRAKTLSFIKTGTFSQPKLICQLAPGKRLSNSPKSRINSNVATIARHGLSHNYVWAYLGGVYLPQTNTQYTETLVNDSAQGKIDKFSNQEPKMLIETHVNSKWNGTIMRTIYTEEEKINLFDQAYNDFGGEGGMNFEYLQNSLIKSRKK